MTYQELIAKALQGRTVNRAAKEWGIPQPTLDKYVKAKHMPDYQTALIIARDAGVDAGEVMRICAAEEAAKKPRGMFLEYGLATVSSMVIAFMLALVGFLAPVNEVQAKPADQWGSKTSLSAKWQHSKSSVQELFLRLL